MSQAAGMVWSLHALLSSISVLKDTAFRQSKTCPATAQLTLARFQHQRRCSLFMTSVPSERQAYLLETVTPEVCLYTSAYHTPRPSGQGLPHCRLPGSKDWCLLGGHVAACDPFCQTLLGALSLDQTANAQQVFNIDKSNNHSLSCR